MSCSPSSPVAPDPAAAARPLQPGALSGEQARLLLKALSDPVRLEVIEALGRGERCVCDLTGDLNLAQSRLSFHLKVLREAGLIHAREQGRWVYYSLRPEALQRLGAWLQELERGCLQPASDCD